MRPSSFFIYHWISAWWAITIPNPVPGNRHLAVALSYSLLEPVIKYCLLIFLFPVLELEDKVEAKPKVADKTNFGVVCILLRIVVL